MAKTKKRAVLLVVCLMLAVLCAGVLAACNNTETYTVTFMVREKGTTGDWQQYTTVDTNDDGSVTLPAEPTVDGYTFRDWYTDEACSADKVFDESKVTADITVYALMAEANITLSVTDGSGTATQIAGTLSALSETTAEQEAAAAEEKLTFDGWYTDAAFTQKYSDGMDATALYGRYMAQITYDNGYETLYSELVTPGTLTSAPDARVDDFVKRYMDDEDISYNDSEGNAIDFTADTFDENEVVTVLWKTPGLEYEVIEGNSYRVSRIAREGDTSYPAVSVLSKNVTIEGKPDCNVVAVDAAVGLDRYDQAEVFIFNEGIESIRGFYAASYGGPSAMKEVRLPSTLKVLEDSFNMPSTALSELILPEGLEVIIDCFWSDMLATTNPDRENGLNISITVPATVNNMVVVPKNLDLSQNDHFEYDDDGRLYYVDGDSKILCSEYQSNVTDDGRLVVEEGVTGVQVYLLSRLNYDYLDLPSTFCEVGYNNAAENYPAYTGDLLTPQAVINDPAVLVLDEPGNDLDTDMLAVVEDLLDGWPGTLLLVTHDRYLMERVTDHQFALIDGKLRHLPGGVEEYLALADEREATWSGARRQTRSRSDGSARTKHRQDASARAELARSASSDDHLEAENARPQLSGGEIRTLRKLMQSNERKMETLKRKISDVREQMAAADPTDFTALGDFQSQINDLQQQIDALEEEWLEAAETLGE